MSNDATIRFKSINSSITILKYITQSSVKLKISNLLSMHCTGLKIEAGVFPSLSSLYSEYLDNEYYVCAVLESACTTSNVTVNFKAIYY